MLEISEVNESLRTNPVQRNYIYCKRESRECENNANSPSGGEELRCTTDSGVREQDKDTTFCVIDETPDNTDEETLVNQDQQETLSGYETVTFN